MLVLSATPGQEIIINEQLVIKILYVRTHNVRLGFSGPKSIRVERRKVYEARRRAPQQRSKGTQDDSPSSSSGVDQ